MSDRNFSRVIDPIIDKHRNEPGNLIPVLHDIQNEVGYLPPEIQQYVADEMNVPLSKIYGVVTFYSFFSLIPKGEHTIGVCMGTACYVKGAEDIVAEVKDQLGGVDLGETSEDGRFTLTITRCLGTCSLAPVMMIDDEVYGNLTPDRVPEILNHY